MAWSADDPSRTALNELRTSFDAYWIPIEAGSIIFATDNLDPDKNLAALTGFQKFFPDLKPKSETSLPGDVACAILPALTTFFAEGKLDPGQYVVPIKHLLDPETGKLNVFLQELTHVEIPAEETVTFDVTPEHLTLLKNTNFECTGGMLATHAKRPYGDMTNYYIDMAALLGDQPSNEEGNNFSDEQEARFEKLHQEMLLAIQAFWTHAEM